MEREGYYSDNTRVNNTSLGWFIKSPMLFKENMEGKGIMQLETSSMSFGTALHASILQPDEFKKMYRVANFDTPSISQQKKFCNDFIANRSKGPREASKIAYMNNYSTKGKSDNKIGEESIALLMKYKKYIQQSSGKMYITWSMYKKILDIDKSFRKNKLTNTYFKKNQGKNEYQINWELNGVECKSLLDRLIIDEDKMEITLIDLKTTNDIWSFNKSIDKYDYLRQMQFYRMAIRYEINNGFYKGKFEDYKFVSIIVALDTNGINDVSYFKLFDSKEYELDKNNALYKEFADKEIEITNIINEISYHNEINDFSHSRNYFESDGFEKLERSFK